MQTSKAGPASNQLLTALPCKDRNRLLAHCEPIDLIFAEVLCRPGDLITHVYFPTGSFISLVTSIDSSNLEIGMVGNEGLFGITLMLEVDIAPFHAVVQGAGPALRITAEAFLHELEQSPALQKELKRYLCALMRQLAQTAACSQFHRVEARLARSLLMIHDRAHSNTFHVTHVGLAYMLGVRRVGITRAANSLQQQKLISYRRGNVRIIDRPGLEAVACSCYRADNEIYERMMRCRR
ncbi:Crp/Fnr family transcriptional regulator [Methylotuvimicrobium buryatense]|uniref:Crp/Fnr family transcriptional regulator n=1 Tax=Methylotuvimicrobium buryatense TaxID=95641 RepID=A0A4V1IK15_METBY|nr:Crp/Fnr family transcriptional regulator [Methylotuvimicrobium buryatense]QCW83325.1 Crp/Fnr family transcriptional regulator [Methylotuvimicrobium buryatense]